MRNPYTSLDFPQKEPAMLADITHPEKEALATEPKQLRDFLETDFKTAYCETTLDRLRLRPEGTVEFGNEVMPFVPGFLEALAQSIDMPLNYAYRLDPELFQHNFEKRKEHCCKPVTLCINRGVAINIADIEYRPARTADVLPGLLHGSFWKFDRARISDRGVEVNLIQDGCALMPLPGDVIQLGVRISNSETGFGGMKASLFSLRLVCSNGAVMADEVGTARWNYDRRVAYATSIEKFQNDLLKLSGKQHLVVRLYGELVQRNLLDRDFANLWRRLRGSLPVPAVDALLGMEPGERRGIQDAVRERSVNLPPQPTRLLLWDIHNRITAVAQRLDFVRRSRMERIGGALLAQESLN
jgi:hypothetical protein